MGDSLVLGPTREIAVPGVFHLIEHDQAEPGESPQGLLQSTLGDHLGLVGEDQGTELIGVRDEATLVIGLSDESHPKPVGAILEATHLPVDLVLGLERADARHYAG